MGLPIGLPERSRRAFWARLYARRRLLSRLAAPFAPLHYALIGENRRLPPERLFRSELLPCPCEHRGRKPRPARGSISPTPNPMRPPLRPNSTTAGTCRRTRIGPQSHPHPFLHFLERGLRAGRRPRADIDVEFVRDITRGVKPRSLEEAASASSTARSSESEMGPPLNREELRARQDRFYADGQLRVERESGHSDRSMLVFVQCGQGFDAAYVQQPRSYDVLLNYYLESDVHPKADIAIVQAGTKTTSIRRLMELRPDLLFVTKPSCFSMTTLKSSAEESKLFSAR